ATSGSAPAAAAAREQRGVDLSELQKRRKPDAGAEPAAGGVASVANKLECNVGEDAGAAEDGLMAVEQALRQRGLQLAVNILLEMARQRAQLLRDTVASERAGMVPPTAAPVIAAGGQDDSGRLSLSSQSSFYEQFISNKSASMTAFGLLCRHFRFAKCRDDQGARALLSIADQIALKTSV
ncbi:unnamed protein product, partial [Prorocentrum cordatum]